MGGFDSFSSIFGAASQVANGTANLRKSYTDYRSVTAAYDRAKQNYDENERSIAEQSALDQKQLQLQSDKAALDRRNALRKSVATQQAAFGGQGIDTTDGSGESAILGLFKNSSDNKTYQDSLDQLKLDGLNQSTTATRRKNLLTLQQNYESARDGLISNLDNYTDYTSIAKKQQQQQNIQEDNL